jgi:hypothetical protein
MKPLKEIERLASRLFSERWINLHSEKSLARPDLKYPGVYLLAYSSAKIDGASIKSSDIFYVGMSNAAGGVAQRLKQFKIGIEKNSLHSGAMRFYRNYSHNRPWSQTKSRKWFYFAALTIPCLSDKAAAQPSDLREMGHVTCFEYYAFANVMEHTGRKPPLNKFGADIPVIA